MKTDERPSVGEVLEDAQTQKPLSESAPQTTAETTTEKETSPLMRFF